MHRKRQETRRIRHSWDGSTTIRIKISPGIAQERTTGGIYPKRIGKIEVETNKAMDFAQVISDGTPSRIVKENCDNGNIKAKGKAVNICNLMIFLECQCNQIA
jgi:hypothetical protein